MFVKELKICIWAPSHDREIGEKKLEYSIYKRFFLFQVLSKSSRAKSKIIEMYNFQSNFY